MRKISGTHTVMIAGLGMLAFMSHSASAESLRYCSEADFPPFSYMTSAGGVEGFDVDVANYICDHMGVECQLVVQEWAGIVPALNAGRCDAIISSMTITPDRREQLLFSEPYYLAPYAFVAPKDMEFTIDRDGLAGKTMCMFKNSSPVPWLEENFGDIVELRFYDGAEQIKTDLLAGRCDTWMETMPSIHGTLLDTPEGEGYHFVGPQFTDPRYFGEGVGIAVRLGDEELMSRINAAVDAMYEDGSVREINDRYFPFYLGRDQ
jgi:arginine/ornithine transport system substrate-binding protein